MWKRDKCCNPTEGLHMGENENVTMRRKFSTGLNQDHPLRVSVWTLITDAWDFWG